MRSIPSPALDPLLRQSPDLVVVLSTFADLAAAERAVRQLIDEELLACANLVPNLTSVFRWAGEVQGEGEVLALMKTRRSLLQQLVPRLSELHPYDVPEVLALPVEACLDAYCRWVMAETGEGKNDSQAEEILG